MRNIKLILAAVLLFGPMAANADPITYQVDLDIDVGTVNGFVTTNGAQGLISQADITAFEVSVFDGIDSFALNEAIGIMLFFNSPAVLATMTSLSIEMNGGSGQVTFENIFVPGDPYRYVGLWEDGTVVIRHQDTPNHPNLDISDSGLRGTYVFATAVPEPGTLALLSLGLIGMAAKCRKKV